MKPKIWNKLKKGYKMHTITLHIEDTVFDKVIYFLKNLPSSEVEIVESTHTYNVSHLEVEIDKGVASGISDKSHQDIVNEIKAKYV